VICFVGDGGFLMTGNELAVAMERKLPLKVIVSENRSYASIWIQQERDYPGRTVGTMFANPDLALIGQAFGFAVTRIATKEELNELPAILARPGPQFIVVATSLDAVRPNRDGNAATWNSAQWS
jgi:acetolactate synthase-1/2/3 large subunit